MNCPFYWKIGACRHGDQCSRSHYKPSSSQTLILRHMYTNPPVALAIAEGQEVTDEAADESQDHFEAFFGEVWAEVALYGEVEDVVCVDNIGDHMLGNLYVKYYNEDDAENAMRKLTGRYYNGRLLHVEYSPVTDFREARCRQFVDGQCTREVDVTVLCRRWILQLHAHQAHIKIREAQAGGENVRRSPGVL